MSAIAPALLEKWALAYLERYASSAENLRRVLQHRARKRLGDDREMLAEIDEMIAALVARYCELRLIDDAAYATARARRRLEHGDSLRRIAAGLAAKGVAASDAAMAVAALRESVAEPDLAAACAFARRRRLGPFRRDAAGDRGRELAAFARAGFDRCTAERVLACREPDAVAALLADDA